MMEKTSLWKIEGSNLDNSSFEIDLFKNDIDHVIEIKANNNYLTSHSFMDSKSLKILDLENNQVQKLELTENDFLNLEKLILNKNNIDTIVCARHDTLNSLLLGNNKLDKLNE
jgi:hypothetical protein